jgi:hypothetical protein
VVPALAAIFIRESATQASAARNEVSDLLRSRLLSLRAYDAGSLMVDADVVDGKALEPSSEHLFTNQRISYLHVHFARPGCYACRIDRAGDWRGRLKVGPSS